MAKKKQKKQRSEKEIMAHIEQLHQKMVERELARLSEEDIIFRHHLQGEDQDFPEIEFRPEDQE